MSAEVALQKGIRARLVGDTAVTSLVPAASVLDRNERPAPDPSIIIGETTSRDDGDTIARDRVHVFADLHVWKREPSTAGVKTVAGAIRASIKRSRLPLDAGFHCVDAFVASTRVLRDPDGLTSHAVVTVEAIVQEV
jgi:hypothetical protein